MVIEDKFISERGYAFVELGSQAAVTKALRASRTQGIKINGNIIKIGPSKNTFAMTRFQETSVQAPKFDECHVRPHVANDFECECGRSFGSEKSLKQHQSMTSCYGCSEQKKVPCSLCTRNGEPNHVRFSHRESNCRRSYYSSFDVMSRLGKRPSSDMNVACGKRRMIIYSG